METTTPSLLAMAQTGAAAPLDTERVNRLITALRAAHTKLQLYRNAHSGEYIGGMEFGALMALMQAAIADCGCAEQLPTIASAP